ncbi:hypothetical protein NQZ68_010205 [Dissostichus eleginoides]|nr:hypothetical protein NQZ68_010205 [Dissostichus eleginoides]
MFGCCLVPSLCRPAISKTSSPSCSAIRVVPVPEFSDWAPLCHTPRTIHEPSLSPAIPTGLFNITAAEDRVTKLVSSAKTSTCSLDPMRTALVKDCLPTLCPYMVVIINSSLAPGPPGHQPALSRSEQFRGREQVCPLRT